MVRRTQVFLISTGLLSSITSLFPVNGIEITPEEVGPSIPHTSRGNGGIDNLAAGFLQTIAEEGGQPNAEGAGGLPPRHEFVVYDHGDNPSQGAGNPADPIDDGQGGQGNGRRNSTSSSGSDSTSSSGSDQRRNDCAWFRTRVAAFTRTWYSRVLTFLHGPFRATPVSTRSYPRLAQEEVPRYRPWYAINREYHRQRQRTPFQNGPGEGQYSLANILAEASPRPLSSPNTRPPFDVIRGVRGQVRDDFVSLEDPLIERRDREEEERLGARSRRPSTRRTHHSEHNFLQSISDEDRARERRQVRRRRPQNPDPLFHSPHHQCTNRECSICVARAFRRHDTLSLPSYSRSLRGGSLPLGPVPAPRLRTRLEPSVVSLTTSDRGSDISQRVNDLHNRVNILQRQANDAFVEATLYTRLFSETVAERRFESAAQYTVWMQEVIAELLRTQVAREEAVISLVRLTHAHSHEPARGTNPAPPVDEVSSYNDGTPLGSLRDCLAPEVKKEEKQKKTAQREAECRRLRDHLVGMWILNGGRDHFSYELSDEECTAANEEFVGGLRALWCEYTAHALRMRDSNDSSSESTDNESETDNESLRVNLGICPVVDSQRQGNRGEVHDQGAEMRYLLDLRDRAMCALSPCQDTSHPGRRHRYCGRVGQRDSISPDHDSGFYDNDRTEDEGDRAGNQDPRGAVGGATRGGISPSVEMSLDALLWTQARNSNADLREQRLRERRYFPLEECPGGSYILKTDDGDEVMVIPGISRIDRGRVVGTHQRQQQWNQQRKYEWKYAMKAFHDESLMPMAIIFSQDPIRYFHQIDGISLPVVYVPPGESVHTGLFSTDLELCGSQMTEAERSMIEKMEKSIRYIEKEIKNIEDELQRLSLNDPELESMTALTLQYQLEMLQGENDATEANRQDMLKECQILTFDSAPRGRYFVYQEASRGDYGFDSGWYQYDSIQAYRDKASRWQGMWYNDLRRGVDEPEYRFLDDTFDFADDENLEDAEELDVGESESDEEQGQEVEVDENEFRYELRSSSLVQCLFEVSARLHGGVDQQSSDEEE